ncbi:carbon-nitrogen family hydrolase [Roseibacillus persicicus]|uniref:carbon-nitrogen family hydrolase n=1 Tax=Roseibacillus persicicus TaxID=454148 RepID=UPI00398B106E
MLVYCCQLDPIWEEKASNLERLASLLAQSQIEKNSLIVLPEMFATGFTMDFEKVAEPAEQSTTLSALADLAKKHQAAILAGLVLERDGLRTNDAVLINSDGSLGGSYSKIHPFTPSGEKEAGCAGSWVRTLPLGEWTLAPFVCYDLRFPEIFRMATPEAELLVVLANWPSPRVEHWVTLLRARAIENQAYVIGVNRAGSDPNLDFPGRSLVIDPKGEIIAEAGSEVEVLTANLDLNEVRQWRNDFPASDDRVESFNLGVDHLTSS